MDNNPDRNLNQQQPRSPNPLLNRVPGPNPSPPNASGPPSQEFIKSLGLFFQRDVIAIPLLKRIVHPSIGQRCQLKAATLELDTASYPNLDYIAGNRLSIYPVNSQDQVQACLKFVINDLTINTANVRQKRARLSDPWENFVQLNGQDSIRLALMYIYDIMTAPSRDFLRLMANCCPNKEQKGRLVAISNSDDAWEKWVCSGLRTLKSTFEEFSSCQMPAKMLFSELSLQQPRQYSISNIKSRKRFRTEIVVLQHRFSTKQIGITLQNIKEREANESKSLDKASQQQHIQHQHHDQTNELNRNQMRKLKSHPTSVVVGHNEPLSSGRSSASIRSLRSVATFGSSPISTQQVSKVPQYSGKVMSMYASSKSSSLGGSSLIGPTTSTGTGAGIGLDGLSQIQASNQQEAVAVAKELRQQLQHQQSKSLSQDQIVHEGLCSNYLLNLKPNDYIICEFVENPRFTLKGNRERPIMMIGQGIGALAFRAFWQQRALEHDRAQVFYTLFKDLSPKKFGDLHLVHITGNKCRLEELFRREIFAHLEHRVLATVVDLDRKFLQNLIDSTVSSTLDSLGSMTMVPLSPSAAAAAAVAPPQPLVIAKTVVAQQQQQKNKQQPTTTTTNTRQTAVKQAVLQNGQSSQMRSSLMQKDLFELGNRLSHLLMDSNGCLYTCCDLAMTQAIEILIVESVIRNHPNFTRDQVFTMLTRWKGNTLKYQHQILHGTEGKKYLFTLENPFERAQIVQEIYDETL